MRGEIVWQEKGVARRPGLEKRRPLFSTFLPLTSKMGGPDGSQSIVERWSRKRHPVCVMTSKTVRQWVKGAQK